MDDNFRGVHREGGHVTSELFGIKSHVIFKHSLRYVAQVRMYIGVNTGPMGARSLVSHGLITLLRFRIQLTPLEYSSRLL